jgi:predicted RNA-binding protein with EMAP domain
MSAVSRLPVAQSSACNLSAAFCDYRGTMRLKVIHVTTIMNTTLTAEAYSSFYTESNNLTNHYSLKYVRKNAQTLLNKKIKWSVAITVSK